MARNAHIRQAQVLDDGRAVAVDADAPKQTNSACRAINK